MSIGVNFFCKGVDRLSDISYLNKGATQTPHRLECWDTSLSMGGDGTEYPWGYRLKYCGYEIRRVSSLSFAVFIVTAGRSEPSTFSHGDSTEDCKWLMKNCWTTVDPAVCAGKPCIRGTRIYIAIIWMLLQGLTPEWLWTLSLVDGWRYSGSRAMLLN